MQPLLLCCVSMLHLLFLECGVKWIDVKVPVTDPNGAPLLADGVLEDRAHKHTLSFSHGFASATIPRPKEGEKSVLIFRVLDTNLRGDFILILAKKE